MWQSVATWLHNSELALVPRVETFAVELAVVAASLARLHALEITFFPPGIAEAIRDVIEQQPHQHQVFPMPMQCTAVALLASHLGRDAVGLTACWSCLA